MDSFEWNKVGMAVLGTVFVVMGLNFTAGSLFKAHKPETPGYEIEVAEASTGGEAEETGPAFDPISPLLASADVVAGEKQAKKCASCHTFDEGGANKVGPALYGIVDRAIAGLDGFGYSAALTEYGNGKTWTYEELNGFLWKPKTFVKGTSMGFGGIRKADDRADLVAYLRSLSANPSPLPAAEAEETAEAEATEETQATE